MKEFIASFTEVTLPQYASSPKQQTIVNLLRLDRANEVRDM